MITLFIDVSHDHRAGIGAYAWHAEVDGSKYYGADLFPEPIEKINVAEVCGVVNGVCAVIKEIRPPQTSKIIAETDSGVAISALEGRSHRHPQYDTLCRMMATKLAEHGLDIEYRRTKAHPWCDRTARALMRQYRSESV